MDGPKAQQASLAQQQQALKEREAKVGPSFRLMKVSYRWRKLLLMIPKLTKLRSYVGFDDV